MEIGTRRILSNDFLVFVKIYELNQAHRRCSLSALAPEVGCLSARTLNRSIDRLLDLGMIRHAWSWEGGTIGPDYRVTENARGFAEDLRTALAQARDHKQGERRDGRVGGASRGIPALPSVQE